MNGLDWSLLRSFLAVVEAGSLSAAARALGTSQPTLSRHVRELEAAVGAALFARSATGLDPTEAALALVEDARAMGAAAEALALKAGGRSEGLAGTVRVTASVVVANLMLPPILARLRREEPRIQVEVVASDATQNLLRRDADLAVRMVAPTQNALIARRIGVSPIGLFATRGYFDRRGRVRAPADLAGHDLIGFDRSDLLIRGLAARGVALGREDFALRTDDPMLGWHLLLAGAGIGAAQAVLARRHPELQPVDWDLPLGSLEMWLVMSEEVRASARIRRVAEALAEGLREALGPGPVG